MSTDIKSMSAAAQDQILAAIKTSQAMVLDGVRTMTSAVGNVMPDIPAIPGIDKLPTPADGIEMGFGFAEQLLTTQREFAEQLLAATTQAAPAKTTKAKS